jgi:glyoxylate/hydroxypyruvate reductase A
MTLLIASNSRAEQFAAEIRALDPQLDVRIAPATGPLEDIRYALVWHPPSGLLAALPNLQLIVSVGAGVDALLDDPTTPVRPLVRFVDNDLTARMVEYVVMNVLYHHRRMTEFRELQARRTWTYLPEPAAQDVRIGIMGLGVLGTAAAAALHPFGMHQLDPFLAETDIVVILLPLTPQTRGLLNRTFIRKLSLRGRSPLLPGPVAINAGRGGLQIDADVLASLDAGELYAASLDVFQAEPLPAGSPLWTHPRVVITPHNAAESAPEAIARYAVRQIKTHARGGKLENIVHRARGY